MEYFTLEPLLLLNGFMASMFLYNLIGFGVVCAPSEEWKSAAREFIGAAKAGDLATVRAKYQIWGDKIIEARDGFDRSALHWAAFGDHVDVVRYLLANNAYICARTKSGMTPYDVAGRETAPIIEAEYNKRVFFHKAKVGALGAVGGAIRAVSAVVVAGEGEGAAVQAVVAGAGRGAAVAIAADSIPKLSTSEERTVVASRQESVIGDAGAAGAAAGVLAEGRVAGAGAVTRNPPGAAAAATAAAVMRNPPGAAIQDPPETVIRDSTETQDPTEGRDPAESPSRE